MVYCSPIGDCKWLHPIVITFNTLWLAEFYIQWCGAHQWTCCAHILARKELTAKNKSYFLKSRSGFGLIKQGLKLYWLPQGPRDCRVNSSPSPITCSLSSAPLLQTNWRRALCLNNMLSSFKGPKAIKASLHVIGQGYSSSALLTLTQLLAQKGALESKDFKGAIWNFI